MQKRTWIGFVCTAVAVVLVGTFTLLTAIRANTAPGLTRSDVIEIRVCEWRMAWRDILPSYSTKDLRAAPHKLWFSFVYGGKPGKPNGAGWVWGALSVPGKNPEERIMYGGKKQNGRWVLSRHAFSS